jgi:type VI secretion system protein ImpL
MLARFIELVFGKSRFEHKILLRGIYFTSGTQEGTPIDRVLGSLSRFLKVERMISPPLVSSGKSFFLTKLLKETIFPESGLVGFDAKREKRRKFILAGTYVSILLIAVVVIVAWALSYYKNETLIKEVQGRAATLAQISVNLPQPASDDWNSVLPFLNQLRDIPYGHAEREKSVPLNFRFGLFQGDRIGDLADETYLRALRTIFLPRVALFLENQISSASQNEVKYEALKAYLMLFDDNHLDKEALIGFLSADWEHVMQESGVTDHNEDFTSHLRASLENQPVSISWSRDDVLIASTRLSLASSSLAERILSRLRIVGVSQSTQSVKLSDMMGSAGTQIFERVGGEPLSTPLPSIFTKSEYRDGFSQAASKVVEQMADEDIWVLGENNSSSQKGANKAELLDVVKRHYLEEYIRNWDAILGSIKLKNSASLNDTLTYARIISAADSPLKKLLVGISKEVTLSAGDTPAVSEKVTDKVYEGAKEMAAKLLGGTPSMTRVQVKNKLPETVVDDHFESLRQLVTASGPGQPMPIDQTLGLLNDFYQELSSFANGGQGATEIKPLSSAIRLKSEAERLPSPLGKIIKDLVTVTLGQTVAANRANIQKAIGGASSFCDKAISGRYPVSTSSSKDIMVADFNSVFSPGGEIDNFFNLNLKQVVDTSGAMWKLRDGAEATSPVSSTALRQFQNADSIRRTFFRGGSTAAVTGDLRLVSSELPQVTLEYNGEAHQFSASGTSAWTLRWPAQNSAGAKLFGSSAALGINTEGDWAIFRLIDKSRIESSSPERLRLAFLLEGKRVVFELRSNSVLNPFRLRELGVFKCPGRN